MTTITRSTAGGSDGQLGALLRLRWTMLRTPRQRRIVVFAMSLLPALAVVAVAVGQLAPDDPDIRFNFALLAPTTFASFFALAVISPASSAGGSELFPSDQLVAYPVRDRTVFGSTLLLAPANLAWITTFLVLLGVTSYIAAPGPFVVLSLVTAVVFAAAMTVTGQAIAWWLEGVPAAARGPVGAADHRGKRAGVARDRPVQRQPHDAAQRPADPADRHQRGPGLGGRQRALVNRREALADRRPRAVRRRHRGFLRRRARLPVRHRTGAATAACSRSPGRYAGGRPRPATSWR